MRSARMGPVDPIQATNDEYRAYDALPPELRELIRESKTDMSARKVLAAWRRDEYDTEKTVERVRAWAKKSTP